MSALTVRKMAFEFPDELDLVFVEGDTLVSSLSLGISVLLPYLEPYLMRTLRKASAEVDDEVLRQDMLQFCRQEGNHFKEHSKANEVMRRHTQYPERLAALERQLDAEYRDWSVNRSQRWNLAYAEGFEALTTITAQLFFEEGMNQRMSSPLRELFEWHLMEELEHRTVAFDAYHHVAGEYFFKIGVTLFAQWHFISYAWRFSKLLRADEDQMENQYRTAEFRKMRRRWHRRFLAKLAVRALKTYLPWYSPRRMKLPEDFSALSERYTAEAVSHS